MKITIIVWDYELVYLSNQSKTIYNQTHISLTTTIKTNTKFIFIKDKAKSITLPVNTNINVIIN